MGGELTNGVICLCLPAFPAWAVAQSLNTKSPVAVVQGGNVVAASHHALQSGVRIGMAADRVPDVSPRTEVHLRDATCEQAMWDYTLERLHTLTPFLEPAERGVAYLRDARVADLEAVEEDGFVLPLLDGYDLATPAKRRSAVSARKASARVVHDNTTKLRIMIGAMVVVGIALIVLLALAVGGGLSSGAEPVPALPDRTNVGDESVDTGTEQPLLDFSGESEAQVVAFLDHWKSTGKATDQDWVAMVEIAGMAVENSPADRHARARHEYALGQVAQRQDEYEEADSWYAAASTSWPDWELPINGQGTLAARRQDYAEAARFYRAAIEADPNWLFPRTNLIGALINLNRYSEVETEARNVLAVHPSSAYAHYGLALAHSRANRPADAISEAETALRLDPSGASGFNATGLREAISSWQQGPRPDSGSTTTTQRGYPRRMIVDAPDDGFLALRPAPSVTSGERIASIPHRTTITVRSCSDRVLSIEGELGHWCRATYAGRSGWVFDGFLK